MLGEVIQTKAEVCLDLAPLTRVSLISDDLALTRVCLMSDVPHQMPSRCLDFQWVRNAVACLSDGAKTR